MIQENIEKILSDNKVPIMSLDIEGREPVAFRLWPLGKIRDAREFLIIREESNGEQTRSQFTVLDTW